MDIKKFIDTNNKERMGKYFLNKAVDFVFEKEFGKAYEYIKEGLDLVTCDCNGGGWKKRYENSKKTLFSDLTIHHSKPAEYYFVKAFFLSYEEENKELYLALDSIENYLNLKDNEYGKYIKSSIYISLKEYDKAYEILEELSQSNSNSRILYRLGKLQEGHFKKWGITNLYKSFEDNPSSACCVRILKKHSIRRSFDLPVDNNEKNSLIISFTHPEDEWKFYHLYEKYLNLACQKRISALLREEESEILIFREYLKKNQYFFEIKYNDDFEGDNQYYSSNDHPYKSPYYNDSLDMDQQSPEFWDSL